MTNTDTRPVIRAGTRDIAAAAEFLSTMFDAPVIITAANAEVATPASRHLVMIVAELPEMGPAEA